MLRNSQHINDIVSMNHDSPQRATRQPENPQGLANGSIFGSTPLSLKHIAFVEVRNTLRWRLPSSSNGRDHRTMMYIQYSAEQNRPFLDAKRHEETSPTFQNTKYAYAMCIYDVSPIEQMHYICKFPKPSVFATVLLSNNR